tara:strand:+ start:1384 stop:2037 length:654 start_codon:yes stop_codon:yes gene_type:complete
MKNFVITIFDNKKSEQAAKRCITSGSKYGGLVIDKWKATTPNDNIAEIIKAEKINTAHMDEVYSRTPNCIAAFISHYSLWKLSVESNEEITIFEHDAVCTNNIPHSINYHGVISLGAPSYGKFNTPRGFGVVPLTSKPYFPGAHAYRVKPAGARMLIDQARMEARPTDVFLNTTTFPFLQEFYPWPAEARDSFTTIQNPVGCKAKHNYNEKYEIVNV